MNAHLSLSSVAVLTPRRAGLRAGADNLVEVLVRIQAPDAPAAHAAARPPQALALVIDRSGSMTGRPLAEARRCAEYVIGKLRPTDAVSLVQFDHRVRRLWPAVPLGDGAPLRAALAKLHSGGNTNLHGGWLDGAESLADVAGAGLKRVIVLSDGQANEGLTEPEAIAAQCAAWAERGIGTSTYGLGNGFNEELMVATARAGGGNHYYGELAEDLMEPFEQELELLGNLCLRELRLAVDSPDGVEVQMANELPCGGDGWRLPDLAWGAEAWAVLRLQVPATSLPPLGQSMTVLQIMVTGRSLDGEQVKLERARLSLPVLSPAAYDALTDDERVSQRLLELAAAEVLLAMRRAAAASDWELVGVKLDEAERRFGGHGWLAAMLASMRDIAASRSHERLSKEAFYASRKLGSRLAARDEDAALSLAQQASVPAYLRRKPAQGKGGI